MLYGFPPIRWHVPICRTPWGSLLRSHFRVGRKEDHAQCDENHHVPGTKAPKRHVSRGWNVGKASNFKICAYIFTSVHAWHVCMQVWMCVCMYKCIYKWMYVCMHAWRDVWMYDCMYEGMNKSMCECMYECMNVFIYVWMYVDVSIFVYVCLCMSMYVCRRMAHGTEVKAIRTIMDWKMELSWSLKKFTMRKNTRSPL